MESTVCRAVVAVKIARLHSELLIGCGIRGLLAGMDVRHQPGNSIQRIHLF